MQCGQNLKTVKKYSGGKGDKGAEGSAKQEGENPVEATELKLVVVR